MCLRLAGTNDLVNLAGARGGLGPPLVLLLRPLPGAVVHDGWLGVAQARLLHRRSHHPWGVHGDGLAREGALQVLVLILDHPVVVTHHFVTTRSSGSWAGGGGKSNGDCLWAELHSSCLAVFVFNGMFTFHATVSDCGFWLGK